MPERLTRGPAVAPTLLAALALALVGGCSAPAPAAPQPSPAATSTAPSPTASSSSPDPALVPDEPTTTNTLPPPPEPTAPAPSSAGDLEASALPVPAGWRTVARTGSEEEGYRGNGTWVHARDPRYAAQDVITIGCADVTRDDYPDPVAALAGDYVDAADHPGVGLALQFADADAAGRYWTRYVDQVRACTTLDDPVHTELVAASSTGPDGLIDRRTYPDSRWTEVARRSGARVTLVILTDAGPRLTTTEARRLIEQLG
ncbi:hypothetical protein [uncultured Friedmanniella sp.]|uniref:hypothetical protein n=1 Tax=uncultured Friedmanniella sp. TaxID=335381 RepID=UPI0035CC226E